jgi:hypothetical protein
MMTKMMLAGLLAFAAVPALAADTTFDRQAAAAVTSADVAHAQAGKQVAGMSHAHACTCMQRGS